MIEIVSSSAELSPCGRYRYQLTRTLSAGKGVCMFTMLNPSKADHEINDQTIRQCLGFVQHWGFRQLLVTNLFAWRATLPREMFGAIDPEGPDADGWILRGAQQADRIVCAWGANGAHRGRGPAVLKLLRDAGHQALHLGLTGGGHPRHPLYLARETALKEFA